MGKDTPDVALEAKTFTPNSFIIPGEVMLDPELQPLDTKVFGIIYWLEHLRDGKCTASNKTIGKILSAHPRSVQRSISNLAEQGYIHVIMKDDFTRTGIITNILFVKMQEGVRPNGRGGGDEMDTQRNNNKNENKYTSEQLTNIKKVYLTWLKVMVVDPAVRFHGTDDDRRAALEAAIKRTKLTDLRRTKINARIQSMGLEAVIQAVMGLSQSDFHRGENDRNWKANLEWLCKSDEKIEEWSNKYQEGVR